MNTELLSHLNWLAVLVAAVAYFAVGGLWYSKILFVKPWLKYTGLDPNAPGAKKGVGQIMFTSFILMVITVIGLAIFLSKVGPSSWMSGAKTGLVAGFCFSAMSLSICYVYEKKPLGLHLINGAYHVVGCIVAATILSVWH